MEGHDDFESSEKPKGIYSTQDLSVDMKNLPAEMGGSAQPEDNKTRMVSAFGRKRRGAQARGTEDGARINAAFAQTEATEQHVATAEAMQEAQVVSSAANPNATASTATGDIQLMGVKKKSNKLPLIIAILVLLVGAGLGLAFGLGWVKLGDEQKVATVTPELKAAYNTYVNYLVEGIESDEDVDLYAMLEDYSPTFPTAFYAERVFAFLEQNETTASRTEYIDALAKKFGELEKAYTEAGFNESLTSLSDYYYWAGKISWLDLGLRRYYIDQGKVLTEKRVKELTTIDTENEELKVYAEDEQTIAMLKIKLYEILDQGGCLTDTHDGCADLQLSPEDEERRLTLSQDASRANSAMRETAVNKLVTLFELIYPEKVQSNNLVEESE